MTNSGSTITKFVPWIFVFLWSTGFVAAKYVHPYAGPFSFLTIRYTIAAVALAAVAVIQNKKFNFTRTQIWHQALVAFLLHYVYIGGVFYSIHLGVTAGISSVIVSMQPVLVALLAIPMLGERFKFIEIVGLALGVVGVALLLLPKVFQGNLEPQFSTIGITAAIVALVGTTLGYITQKKTGDKIDFVTGTAVQYAVTAALFLVTELLFGDNFTIQWTPQFIGGLAWSSLALSIGSIFLLYSLLRKGSAGSVSSLYYLVPPFAAVQAYFLFGEVIPAIGLVGMALAGLGVMLVMRETGADTH
jgi:drug/metabolite transporter (DMT)-like permease